MPKNYHLFVLMDGKKEAQVWPKMHLMNNLFCLILIRALSLLLYEKMYQIFPD